MVFKDGSLTSYKKAKKLGVPIVSVSWIEACKAEGRMVDESSYPTISKERYDSPGLFPRIRKYKSMQPKTDEEIRAKIEAKLRKKKRLEAKKAAEREAAKGPSLPIFRELTNFNKPKNVDQSVKRRDSLLEVLQEMKDTGR